MPPLAKTMTHKYPQCSAMMVLPFKPLLIQQQITMPHFPQMMTCYCPLYSPSIVWWWNTFSIMLPWKAFCIQSTLSNRSPPHSFPICFLEKVHFQLHPWQDMVICVALPNLMVVPRGLNAPFFSHIFGVPVKTVSCFTLKDPTFPTITGYCPKWQW